MTKTGVATFAKNGLIWDDEPKASSRLERKQITNINMEAIIIIFDILLFCLMSETKEDAKIVRKDMKKGNIIKL